MRIRLVLLLVTGLALLAPRAHAEDGELLRTPAQAARAAFDALKSESKSGYEALLPPTSELQTLLETALATLTQEKQDAARKSLEQEGGYAEMLAKMRTKALTRFELARTQSAEAFEWNRAIFAGLDKSRQHRRMDGPLELLRVHFLIRVDDELHEFSANNVLLVANRWCFPEGVSYRGPVASDLPRKSEAPEQDQESPRQEITELRMELKRISQEAREREVEYRKHIDKLRGDQSKRMQEAYTEASHQLEAERKAMRQRIDEFQQLLEEKHAKSSETLNALRDARASSEDAKARLAMERDTHASHLAAAEQLLRAQQEHERQVIFVLKELMPILVPALSHNEERVRVAAEFLAEMVMLEAARPHFQKLFDNTKTPVDRRLRAATFLARTGEPRPLAPALKQMLRAGVGLGDGEQEEARHKTLTDLLETAGVDKAEISRIAKGEDDKR